MTLSITGARSLVFALFSLLMLGGCATPSVVTPADNTLSTEAFGPKQFQQEGFTAVVVAYGPEMKGILGRIEADPGAQITQVVKYKGVTYRIGKYHDEPILVFATGMSIANAALTMQMAFDYFPVKQVVYMGIAGAVNPDWQPGDVIVPERCTIMMKACTPIRINKTRAITCCRNITPDFCRNSRSADKRTRICRHTRTFTSSSLTKC